MDQADRLEDPCTTTRSFIGIHFRDPVSGHTAWAAQSRSSSAALRLVLVLILEARRRLPRRRAVMSSRTRCGACDAKRIVARQPLQDAERESSSSLWPVQISLLFSTLLTKQPHTTHKITMESISQTVQSAANYVSPETIYFVHS